MRLFPKSAILALSAAVGLQLALGAPEPKKEPAKPADAKKPGEKSKTPKAKAEPDAPKSSGMNVPVPVGDPQKVVKFPFYNDKGFLDMRFEAGVATKVDDVFVKLQKLRVETFKPDDKGKPQPDLDMDLPDALLNQKTRDLTSNTAVTIKCKDWQITGNSMVYNLETRQGTLGGGVKMIINDLSAVNSGPKERPSVEFQKPKEAPPKK
jgi:hypothetical protein